MNTVRRFDMPPPAPAPAVPDLYQLLGELQGSRDLVRLAKAVPGWRKLPRAKDKTAVLIPGWKAPEASMTPLKLFLKSRGVDARHWGLGINQGDPERDAERLAERIAPVASKRGPVTLVGWSLGGVIAREVARELPEQVEQVITYGSPIIGGPTYTPAAASYGEEECERIADLVEELDSESPIQVPITAIFSRKDGIVSWPACIDRSNPRVTHYEVQSTHLSMGIDPDVWHLVLSRLAH
ncbi:MAG: alpha/beta hydrolase [Pseudomonadota bacterium]